MTAGDALSVLIMSIKCVTLKPMGIKRGEKSRKGRGLNNDLFCGKPNFNCSHDASKKPIEYTLLSASVP